MQIMCATFQAEPEADIIKFMDMLPEEKLREVPDPYYTGNFEEVYEPG